MLDTQPKKKCTYCDETRIRIWNGKKLRDGSKIYTDEKNHRWAGKRCPACEHQRVRSSLKFDAFKRKLIIDQFIQEGYTIKCKNHPILIEKDNVQYSVGIKQAIAKKGGITFEKEENKDADYYAILFQTVRIVSKSQLKKITSNITVLNKIPNENPRLVEAKETVS
jgi:hypothetical protein